ncbi:MAG: tyrosine-type recombinase/integrase [Acidobacteriota bacterium]
MKSTYQQGTIYEASNSFFVRYFATVDGVKKRVSHKLCDRDETHYSITCPAVRALRDAHMVNERKPKPKPTTETLITDYWEKNYLPTINAGLKPSTVEGYKDLWDKHLKAHFTGCTFRGYDAAQGNQLLNTLVAQKYSRRTIAHIRSLASGIFTYAINDNVDGMLTNNLGNPWRNVKTKIKPPKPKPTAHYTLTEVMDIINNKLTRIDAQLVICLAGLMGLRPSEIIGLCWEDVNLKAGKLRLHQAYVRGHLGTIKNDLDVSLRMLKTVHGIFKAWHEQNGSPTDGWVFPNSFGDVPINIRDYVVTVLRPAIGKKHWKGLYAFRRGAGTVVTQITGNPLAAQQLLRHLDLSTTMRHYLKEDRAALEEAVQLMDERLALSK